MFRASGLMCVVGAICLGVAGCGGGQEPFLQQVGAFFFMQPSQDSVVAGSVDAVAVRVKATLEQLGMAATITPEGSAVRVVSRTRAGQEFSLLLTREPGVQGEQTRVKLEWKGNPDHELGSQMMARLTIGQKR